MRFILKQNNGGEYLNKANLVIYLLTLDNSFWLDKSTISWTLKVSSKVKFGMTYGNRKVWCTIAMYKDNGKWTGV